MMIDGLEAVQFVAGAFLYGGDAPEEIDEEIASEIIAVWKEERLIDVEDIMDEAALDEWEDDLGSDADDKGPVLVTTDGEPLVFCKAEHAFEKGDRGEIVRRLDDMADLQREQDDGSERWVWVEDRDERDLLIGSIELKTRRLWVESMSVKRSATISAALADHLGDLVRYVDLVTERATPEMMARRAAEARGGETRPALSPEIEREAVQRTMEQHYRRWPDEEIPALGGLTPREAVQDSEGRQRVIALLREFDERQESAPEAMRDFDFGFLWRELGLDESEPGTK
jgi:hypothetical protein